MFGNRAIYSDGWFARTIHRAPWQTSDLQPLTSDVWELYDVRNDFSLTKNLAAEQAAKLKEMQALFMKEAEKYHVLPHRRPDHRAHQSGARGPAGRARRPHVAHALRGHAGDAGKHLHEHQEPVEQDHRGAGDPGRRAKRRDPVAGRALRRVVAVHEGRQAGVHLQLPRAGALHHRGAAGAAARSGRPSRSTSSTTAAAPARVARRRCWSTASPSPKDASRRRSRISSRRTRRRTSASTTRRRSPRASASARRRDSPAGSTRSPSKWVEAK